jgi:hypothetical protein
MNSNVSWMKPQAQISARPAVVSFGDFGADPDVMGFWSALAEVVLCAADELTRYALGC